MVAGSAEESPNPLTVAGFSRYCSELSMHWNILFIYLHILYQVTELQ